MTLLCILSIHCYHEDYNKPFTWEEVEIREKHGPYKPVEVVFDPSPPLPSHPMPAGYKKVCCHCNKEIMRF